MNMFVLGVFLLVTIAASEATLCTSDANCTAGSCCYFKPLAEIASKKRQISLLDPLVPPTKIGICEAYLAENDPCDPFFAIMNGHCGCSSDYNCLWFPYTTTHSPIVGRSERWPHQNEPGSYRCA